MVEGNCQRCHKSDVGELTPYKEHDLDKLLCQDCIKEIDDYYSLTCFKCGKPAHMRGNLLEYENKKICPVCMDEINLNKNFED